MSRIIVSVVYSALLSLCAPAGLQAAGNDPVKAFADRVAASLVKFGYSYEMIDGDVKMTGSGSVSVQGDSYRMSGDGLEIWCDGRSVCTVDDSAKEVVIEPLWAGSGAFVNPAAAIRDIDTGFSWDDSGSRTVFNGQDVLVYELSPNGPAADISGMKLYFSPDGHTLTGAEVQTVKVTVTFVISSLEFLRPGDGTEFAIPMFGPDYFVTDLR